VIAIPGTHKVHSVQPASDRQKVKVAFISDAKEMKTSEAPTIVEQSPSSAIEQSTSSTVAITVGDSVSVVYDGKDYPGKIIITIEKDDIEVSWKWPPTSDRIFYSKENVKKSRAVGNRGQFTFEEIN